MNRNYDHLTKYECQTEIENYEDGFYTFKDTVFYGKKGGQPDDVGTINGLDVIELKWDGDKLLHKVNGELSNPIHMKLDEETRFLAGSIQTAYHIMDGYFHKKGLYVTEVSSDPENLWFEVNQKNISKEELDKAEDFANKVIREDIKLKFTYINGKDYPDDFYKQFDELRIVTIEGVDEQPCGTCHVESTGQIGSFVFLNTENTKRGTKVHVGIGQNASKLLKKANNDLIELGKILSTSSDQVVERANELVLMHKNDQKKIKDLEESLLKYRVKDIDNLEGRLAYLENEPSANIRNLGQELLNSKSNKRAIYTIENNQVFFALISDEDKTRDYLNKLKDKSIIVKGGGSNKLVSGKFDLKEDMNLLELFKEVTE
ncbi:MAG: hypothetical protein PUG67_02045 [Peptoniphilaceae bacterium]|nr:hypothetical protein [Peptoniphilaceae bacterium]MDY6019210.1 hypothetical protein [Anaerococcus sp.]